MRCVVWEINTVDDLSIFVTNNLGKLRWMILLDFNTVLIGFLEQFNINLHFIRIKI